MFQDDTVRTAFFNNVWYAVISLVFQVGGSMIIAALLEEKWMRRAPVSYTHLVICSMG